MPMKDVVSCPEPVASVTAGNRFILLNPFVPTHVSTGNYLRDCGVCAMVYIVSLM